MATSRFLSRCFTVLLSAVVAEHPNKCVYTMYMTTGSTIKAGTDSKISLPLGKESGHSVCTGDLKSWGLMETSNEYSERGNLDVFSGRRPCLNEPVCRLNISSDGSRSYHGWFCHYVEVTSTRLHEMQHSAL